MFPVHLTTFSKNKEQVNSTQSKLLLEGHQSEITVTKPESMKSGTWSNTGIYARFTNSTCFEKN